MISDEVKQAIREATTESWNAVTVHGVDHADDVVRRVEAKLSPKHPPKGAICEVWDEHFGHEIYVSCGDGTFATWQDGKHQETDNITFGHYRVIPTAQDALKAMAETVKHGGSSGVMEMYDYLRDTVQDLIDNAEEG